MPQAELIVSIHDVMPETLDRVERIATELEATRLPPATLLVIPGRAWRSADLARLGRLVAAGHPLAGHGWRHEVHRFGGWWHRLHGYAFSRNVAEHLALDNDGIRRLITDCYAWFDRHGLPAPEFYVPPAWAMGCVPRRELTGLGFRYFETLSGVYDARASRFEPIPLLGFEADTPLRAYSLRLLNRLCSVLARITGRVRLAIHPYDLELACGSDLRRLIAGA